MVPLWVLYCLACLSVKRKATKIYASIHTGSFSVISKETHPFPAGFRFFNHQNLLFFLKCGNLKYNVLCYQDKSVWEKVSLRILCISCSLR